MFTNISQRICRVVDILFPKKVLKSAAQLIRYTDYLSLSTYGIFTYASLPIKREVLNIKKNVYTPNTEYLANIYMEYLIGDIEEKMILQKPILLHIPSSTYSSGARKFDHMEQFILRYIKDINCFFEPQQNSFHILNKTIQHTLNRKERFASAKDKFALTEGFLTYLKTHTVQYIYCIDDVTTTGATRLAVEHILKSHSPGSTVIFLAIASQD